MRAFLFTRSGAFDLEIARFFGRCPPGSAGALWYTRAMIKAALRAYPTA